MPMTSEISKTPAIACDLNAIETDYRDQHIVTAKQLFALVQEVRDLPEGLAFRLPNDTDTFMHAAKYIAHERQCCPFFNFTLSLEAENGSFWFELTGQEGVKQFLQSELRHLLDQPNMKATGLS